LTSSEGSKESWSKIFDLLTSILELFTSAALEVVLVLVNTAILIPMYPARIEVPAPTRNAMAVYGKLVLGVAFV